MYRLEYSFRDFGRINRKYGLCAAIKNDWKHTDKAVRRGLGILAVLGGTEALCLGALAITADYASIVDMLKDCAAPQGMQTLEYHAIGVPLTFVATFLYTYTRRSPLEKLSENDQEFLKQHGIMQ